MLGREHLEVYEMDLEDCIVKHAGKGWRCHDGDIAAASPNPPQLGLAYPTCHGWLQSYFLLSDVNLNFKVRTNSLKGKNDLSELLEKAAEVILD
jgi:hypothetical protein